MTESFPFRSRLEECQSRLERRDVDLLALFPSPNLSYLTGFREEPAERHLLYLVTPDGDALVAPSMYEDQVVGETFLGAGDVYPWDDGDDPVALVSDVLAELQVEDDARVLLDDTMFARFTLDLQDVLPGASFGLASAVLDGLRITKDEHELAALREAARITDEVCEAVRSLGSRAAGMTERELVGEMRSEIERRGGEGFSFDPIVGSGPNGAHPHYRHGDRTIGSGEPVVLDFGTTVDGYPGDMTRTVVFDGDPPAEFETVYETVREAFEVGVAAVEPGVEAQEVDRAARRVIEEAGYGDQFLHRTGHGVGLEVHEAPYIVEGNRTRLEPGMVHSVEPGVYLEGEYGVRLEDLVVVTEDGCEQLNRSPRSWTVSQ